MWRNVLLVYITVLLLSAYVNAAPDKIRVAFVKDGYVSVCDQNGGSVVRISPKSKFDMLRWSPDGKRIACINTSGKRNIPCVMSSSSLSYVNIRNTAFDTTIPEWSPDSRMIVFACREKPGEDLYYEGPPFSIYTYDIQTKQLKLMIKNASSYLPVPTFISPHQIAYGDIDKSELVIYDLDTRQSTRTKMDEFLSGDYMRVEMTCFADTLAVLNEAEQGRFLRMIPIKPEKPSWFPLMYKRLYKSLEMLDVDGVELTPGADGKSAYLVFNNDGDLSGVNIPQHRAYRIDEKGSYMLFSTTGKYRISQLSPLGQGRYLYCRTTTGDPIKEELRIYDMKSKASTSFLPSAKIAAVWPRQ